MAPRRGRRHDAGNSRRSLDAQRHDHRERCRQGGPSNDGLGPRTGDRSPNGRGVTCRRIATTVPTTLLTASAPPTRGDSEHRKDDHEYRAQLVGLIVDGHGLPGGSNANEMPIGVVVIDIDADVRWRVLYSAATSEAGVAESTTCDQAGCRMTSARSCRRRRLVGVGERQPLRLGRRGTGRRGCLLAAATRVRVPRLAVAALSRRVAMAPRRG